KYIGFIMLLFAGTSSLLSFKYYVLIVKMLKQWRISAGNFLLKSTSETKRNNIEFHSENLKKISEHLPKHLKLLNDEQLGHYLAGLIDGIGQFNLNHYLVIELNSFNLALGYYIKKKLGYGRVIKVQNKNIYLFILSDFIGFIKLINLINGKLRTLNKFNQLNNILMSPNFLNENLILKINNTNDFNNHWLAGFSDSLANFQIIINFKNSLTQKLILNPEIKLNYQIKNKENNIFILLKEIFGGIISYNNLNKEYTYSSNSFGSVRKIINYFNRFHLQSNKHVNYLKWRKTYILIQNELTEKNIKRIIKIKNSMNRNSI
uniref:hypothetical protein n=1 Tax=Coccidioides immitis TaxID=5501 RepID=UPI001D01E9B0